MTSPKKNEQSKDKENKTKVLRIKNIILFPSHIYNKQARTIKYIEPLIIYLMVKILFR